MAFTPNSYSRWLQQPCPATNGINGNTGPQGPPGTPGTNGISSGANYFFNLPSNIITSGVTGGTIDITNRFVGANNSYIGSDYGYFLQQRGTGTNVTIARFTSLPGLPSVIPSGPWVFYNNIYSFRTPTDPQPWAIPTIANVGTVYASVTYVDGSTSGPLLTTGTQYTSISDDTVILIGSVNSPITINNPSSAYFYVDFIATSNSIGNVYELWTNGNSVAYVTTTFSPQQGNTGPRGPTGLQGETGPGGPAGQGVVGTPGQVAFFGANGVATGLPTLTTDGIILTVNDLRAQSSQVSGNLTVVGNIGSQGRLNVGDNINDQISFPSGNLQFRTQDGSLPPGVFSLYSLTNGTPASLNVPLSLPSTIVNGCKNITLNGYINAGWSANGTELFTVGVAGDPTIVLGRNTNGGRSAATTLVGKIFCYIGQSNQAATRVYDVCITGSYPDSSLNINGQLYNGLGLNTNIDISIFNSGGTRLYFQITTNNPAINASNVNWCFIASYW